MVEQINAELIMYLWDGEMERVNSLEERREASLNGAKVRQGHAILMVSGRGSVSGGRWEENVQIGVRPQSA